MNLLVDMGNTRLKWAISQDQQFIIGEPLINTQINQQALLTLWQDISHPQQLAIACVTANQTLELVINVALSLWVDIKILRVNSQAQGFGVINAYAQPEKLGVDRWLALCAARHLYKQAVCIVDCGTAITVDLIDNNGQHLGGFISAGLTLMKQALLQGTNALPFASENYALAPAHFTEAAIYGGTLLAAIGLIEKVSSQHHDMLVLLTGGDAPLIAAHLNVSCLVELNLVLHGLAIVADANRQKGIS